jgi:hypothetical protein
MSGLSEREAFEAWAHQHGFSLAAVVEGDDYLNDATADAWDAWQARAALPVQQGWQLVPTTPTPEMLDAASKLLMTPLDGMARAGIKGPYGVYRAMLAASPQPKEAP